MRNNLKGLAIDKETIIIFILVMVVFIFVVAFLYRTFVPGTKVIYSERELRAECAKWQVERCKEDITTKIDILGKPKYPALNQTYRTNEDEAKKFCNCPE